MLNENANCFLTYYKSFFSVFFFLEMNKYKHCQNDLYNENQTQPLLMFFVWALKSNFSETAWSPPTGCLIYYFYFLTLFEKSESVQNIYSHNLILRVSSRIIVFRLHNGHFYTFFHVISWFVNTPCADPVSHWEWSKNWKKQIMCLLFITTLHNLVLLQRGMWLLTDFFQTLTWILLQSISVLHVTFSCIVMPCSYVYMHARYDYHIMTILTIFGRWRVFFSYFFSNVTKYITNYHRCINSSKAFDYHVWINMAWPWYEHGDP